MANDAQAFRKLIENRLHDFGLMFNQDGLDKMMYALSEFHLAPSKACDCGKPVVFILGSQEFVCSRCHKKWQLVIEVKEVI